jgi:DNA-binding NtrC family response regulator
VKTSQILVIGPDSRLSAVLEGLQLLKIAIRHPRDTAECLELLGQGKASVVVLKVGRHTEEEMTLLSLVSRHHPDTGVVVVSEAIHAHLAGLAWDLGASYVMILPQPQELLTEVVAGLLRP